MTPAHKHHATTKRSGKLRRKPKSKRAPRTKTIDVPNRINVGYVERLAQAGLIDEQLAVVLGISRRTLDRYKKNPIFMSHLQRGKKEADKKVEASLFKVANGYDYPEITSEPVLQLRQRDGKQETICLDPTLTVTKVVIKHQAPSVSACMAWLTNRDNEHWKHKPLSLELPGGKKLEALFVVPAFSDTVAEPNG